MSNVAVAQQYIAAVEQAVRGMQNMRITRMAGIVLRTLPLVLAVQAGLLFSASADTETQRGAPTTSTLSSSVDPSLPGQSVTLTVHVSGVSGGPTAMPTGSVVFYDASTSTTLGTVTLDASATATFSTSTLTTGTHNIYSSYRGDSMFAISYGNVQQVVQTTPPLAKTNTAMTSSADPSLPGQSVTFSAHVSGASGGPTATPTGSVNF
jgi:hypothetical protein